jgi:5-methylcytosine-specific restriction endonuclease McrA
VFSVRTIQEYHQWLKDFNKEYRKLGRRHLSAKPYRATLKRLRELGTLKCQYLNPRPLEEKRERFNTKGQKRKYLRFGQCFLCYQKAYLVRHHIVWLSNGGGNEKANVITLCELCHAEIHPWLKETLRSKKSQSDKLNLQISKNPLFDKLFT